MDVDEIEAAACAIANEVGEVLETSFAATVGHGWSAELHLAVEGLHVLFIDGDAFCDIEVGLARVVWLVGAVV